MEMHNLDEISDATIKCKIPKRILHFSDGQLEEFSSDEDEPEVKPSEPPVDEKSMTWAPWLAYKTYQAGNKFLAGCDYVGEGLAYALGVTSPKYNYEIEQYKRSQSQQQPEATADGHKPEREMLSNSSQDVQATVGENVVKY